MIQRIILPYLFYLFSKVCKSQFQWASASDRIVEISFFLSLQLIRFLKLKDFIHKFSTKLYKFQSSLFSISLQVFSLVKITFFGGSSYKNIFIIFTNYLHRFFFLQFVQFVVKLPTVKLPDQVTATRSEIGRSISRQLFPRRILEGYVFMNMGTKFQVILDLVRHPSRIYRQRTI